jgi:hypothetical protein
MHLPIQEKIVIATFFKSLIQTIPRLSKTLQKDTNILFSNQQNVVEQKRKEMAMGL